MTDKKLKEVLLKRLGVSPQRLSQRVQILKRQFPMTTEEATYCIAHKEGLSLDKFLPREKIESVRVLLANAHPLAAAESSRSAKPKTVVKTRQLAVGGHLKIQDPILPEKVLAEAQEMAGKAYPMLYVFENSVREVILRLMRDRLGENWWNSGNIPGKIRDEVEQRRQTEEKEAWHGKRAAHAIYYTNIDDLVRIVQNNWKVFKGIFPRQDWFANIVLCMEVSRNTVAHMNPLSKHDIDRVRVNFRDWEQQITAKKSSVP